MSLYKLLDPLGLFATPVQNAEMQNVRSVNSAEEGKPIGVLWGTRDIESLNYTFFGDTKQVAIKTRSGK